MQKQVEARLKFYDNGELPPKNAEVMQDAVLKAEEAKNEIIKKDKKKKKKEKKKKAAEEEQNGQESMDVSHENGVNGKTNGAIHEDLEEMNLDETEKAPKKKKKKSSKE